MKTSSIDDVTEISPLTLPGSTPELESYDSVSPEWQEREYHVGTGSCQVEGGYWTGEPGSVRFDAWPYSEICVILKGSVRIEDSHGATREFCAGQAFLIPCGFAGTWHTLVRTEKVFIGVAPD